MFRKIINNLKNPRRIILTLGIRGFLSWLSDRQYLKLSYRILTGKRLNLKKPILFSEKIQWLKLYDRRKEYIQFVDKYVVRKYISETLGEEYLIPLINVYDSVNDINWDELPEKFVIKCTHGSGSNIVCTDKEILNKEKAKKNLKNWMRLNWYWFGREWPYKNIKPRIIIEEFLPTKNNELPADYKFYCFNGEPLYCQVIRGRGNNETIDFFDTEWNKMPFNGMRNLPMSNDNIEKPEHYSTMLELSKTLSKGIPFIRVDFYYVNKKIYFGELTLYPTSGYGEFKPKEWNEKLGNLMKIDL